MWNEKLKKLSIEKNRTEDEVFEFNNIQEISDEVFRLRCGHAFHNVCLCRSLRNDSGCPMCRGQLSATPEEVIHDMRIVVDANGVLSIEHDADVPSSSFDLEEARLVSETLSTIGQKTKVQEARAKVNKATKIYRKMEQSLMRKRCALISKAIESFRAECRTPFDKVRKDLKRKLRNLKKTETAEVANILQDIDLNAYINYEVEAHVGNGDTFGPLKHSFWKH
jgi:hypothetical protein